MRFATGYLWCLKHLRYPVANAKRVWLVACATNTVYIFWAMRSLKETLMQKYILAIVLTFVGCDFDATLGQSVSVSKITAPDAKLTSDAGSDIAKANQEPDSFHEIDAGANTVDIVGIDAVEVSAQKEVDSGAMPEVNDDATADTEVVQPEEIFVDAGCQTNADCDDQNGCTDDICKAGLCVHPGAMYMFPLVSEDQPFNCVPCKNDSDCSVLAKSYCKGPWGKGPGSSPIQTSSYASPTGKCLDNHKCEFVTKSCSDGDIRTSDTCMTPPPSPGSYSFGLMVVGECQHETGTWNYECWCRDDAISLECDTVNPPGEPAGTVIVASLTTCPNNTTCKGSDSCK